MVDFILKNSELAPWNSGYIKIICLLYLILSLERERQRKAFAMNCHRRAGGNTSEDAGQPVLIEQFSSLNVQWRLGPTMYCLGGIPPRTFIFVYSLMDFSRLSTSSSPSKINAIPPWWKLQWTVSEQQQFPQPISTYRTSVCFVKQTQTLRSGMFWVKQN